MPEWMTHQWCHMNIPRKWSMFPTGSTWATQGNIVRIAFFEVQAKVAVILPFKYPTFVCPLSDSMMMYRSVHRIQGVWELSLGKGIMKRRNLESWALRLSNLSLKRHNRSIIHRAKRQFWSSCIGYFRPSLHDHRAEPVEYHRAHVHFDLFLCAQHA